MRQGIWAATVGMAAMMAGAPTSPAQEVSPGGVADTSGIIEPCSGMPGVAGLVSLQGIGSSNVAMVVTNDWIHNAKGLFAARPGQSATGLIVYDFTGSVGKWDTTIGEFCRTHLDMGLR